MEQLCDNKYGKIPIGDDIIVFFHDEEEKLGECYTRDEILSLQPSLESAEELFGNYLLPHSKKIISEKIIMEIEKNKGIQIYKLYSPNQSNRIVNITENHPLKLFTDYKILKELGEGAFGKVYKVSDKSGKVFAMKIINKDRDKNQTFLKEITFGKEIGKHENVVEFIDYFEDKENGYIILEYVDGVDLKEKLNEMEYDEIKNILFQSISGLQYIHSLGIIHRDIKPGNILVNKSGVCKITDYGGCIYYQKDLTETFGTTDYLSPEVIRGKPYDFSVDMWAMGVLTYTIITGGDTPFGSRTTLDTYNKILSASYEFPEKFPKEGRDFVSQLLILDSSQRLTAEEALKNEFFN